MMGLVHLTVIGAETIFCIIKGVNYILVPLICMRLDKIAEYLITINYRSPKLEMKESILISSNTYTLMSGPYQMIRRLHSVRVKLLYMYLNSLVNL